MSQVKYTVSIFSDIILAFKQIQIFHVIRIISKFYFDRNECMVLLGDLNAKVGNEVKSEMKYWTACALFPVYTNRIIDG